MSEFVEEDTEGIKVLGVLGDEYIFGGNEFTLMGIEEDLPFDIEVIIFHAEDIIQAPFGDVLVIGVLAPDVFHIIFDLSRSSTF